MTADTSTSLEFFSGRERELGQAVELHRKSLKTRSGGLYLVTGPAGIGKTWFCRKLLEELSRGELFPLVLKYRFTGDDDLNDSCASLLRQAAHQRPNDDLFEASSPFQRAILHRLIPDLVAATDQRVLDEGDGRVAAPVWRRCFGEIAGREDYGLLLWFDDVHQAPAAAWDWIAGLCRQALADRLPLSILIGLRRCEEAAAVSRQAAALLVELREEQLFLKTGGHQVLGVELNPLTMAETGQLLDKYFGAGFSVSYPEYRQWLWEKSGGNAFFEQLLVQFSIASHLVDRDGEGEWRYQRARAAAAVGTIDDMVARRVMDALAEPPLEEPLRLAVALGDAFRFEDWRQLLGLPRPAAVELLLVLQRRGVLSDFMLGNEHRVQFAHPLLLEAFRSILPVEQQRQCHRAAAMMFHAADQHVQAFDHLLACAAPGEELAAMLPAALRQARDRDAWTTVLQWADSVTGLAPGEQARLTLAALKAARLMGRVREAHAQYQRLEAMRGELSPDLLIDAAIPAAHVVQTEDYGKAMALLEDALARCTGRDDAAERQRRELLLNKFFLLEGSHQYQQATDLGRELLALDPDDSGWTFKIYNTLGLIQLRQGGWDDADRIFREHVVPIARRSSETSLARALENHGSVLARLCRFNEAEPLFDEALAIADRYVRIDLSASILNSRSNVFLRQGQFKKAMADKERAARIAFTLGNQSLLASCLNDIAGIKMELGEQADVIELFHRSLQLKEAVGNRGGCATTMNNIAECYLRGIGTPTDYHRALEWSLRANRQLVELGYNANLVDNLVTLSQANLGLGKRDQALDYAEQAMATAVKFDTPYNKATALAQKGTVLLALDSDGAEPALRQAAELFRGIDNRSEQARLLHVLAGYYQARNAMARAGELALQVAGLYRELKLEKQLARLIDQFPAMFKAQKISPQSPARPGGLRIQTLGPFRVTPVGGGQPLPDKQWGSRLGRLMLAYLLTVDYGPRQGVDRELILQTFWNDSGAGGSMRVLLHRVRACLNCHEAVLFADNKYSFNWRLPDIWFDREQLDARCAKGVKMEAEGKRAEAWEQFEQAEAMFRGPYMEGIDEPWTKQTRKTMAKMHDDILNRLIKLSDGLGRAQAAGFYREKRAPR